MSRPQSKKGLGHETTGQEGTGDRRGARDRPRLRPGAGPRGRGRRDQRPRAHRSRPRRLCRRDPGAWAAHGAGRRATSSSAPSCEQCRAAGRSRPWGASTSSSAIRPTSTGADFLEYDPETFARVIEGTLTGGFHMSQLVARHMVERGGGGKIVFISSVPRPDPYRPQRRLQRRQGRPEQHGLHHRHRAVPPSDQRQRHRAGLDRHARRARVVRQRGDRRRPARRSPGAGSARPRTSARPPCSSPPTTPITSPAPPCSSTAASIFVMPESKCKRIDKHISVCCAGTFPWPSFLFVDLIVFVAYMLLLVGVGLISMRQQKNLKGYFLADQNVNWLIVAISVLAALFSGISFLGRRPSRSSSISPSCGRFWPFSLPRRSPRSCSSPSSAASTSIRPMSISSGVSITGCAGSLPVCSSRAWPVTWGWSSRRLRWQSSRLPAGTSRPA